MERFRLYRYLQLRTFAKEELEDVFDRIARLKDGTIAAEGRDVNVFINEKKLTFFLVERIKDIESEEQKPAQPTAALGGECFIQAHASHDQYDPERQKYAQHEARRILEVFDDTSNASNSTSIPKDQFVQTLLDQATAVDYKTMAPITFSILLVGTSVGIVTPAMPFVVSALELTPGQYGTVVSAFALAKMVGNIPSAILVERHGRKVR